MKKVFIIFMTILFSLSIKAQIKSDFENDTYKLVEIVSKPAFAPVIDQFSGMVAVDKKEEFLKELDKTFPELFESMAKIYMDEFTHQEIKDLLDFYATPTGEKMATISGTLAQKGMMAGQSWGMKVQEIISKFQ